MMNVAVLVYPVTLKVDEFGLILRSSLKQVKSILQYLSGLRILFGTEG